MGTNQSVGLFEKLTDEQLEELIVKLNALPSGKEFKRRIETGLKTTIDAEDRTYEEISNEYGDLVGYVDADESRLPWWLRDFNWSVTSDSLSPLDIDSNSLDRFEQYPADSTRIEDVTVTGVDELIEGLDAFLRIEEQLSEARGFDVEEIAPRVDTEAANYEMPEIQFSIPEKGRLATSDAFKEWFERVLNLCPPASPEMTGLLRINTGLKYQHTVNVLQSEQIERLSELSVFDSTDKGARARNEAFLESIRSLLQIRGPFDIAIKLSPDKNNLTTLQYAYYREWAENTPRISNEQQWLRSAKNTDSATEEEEYRFAEFAFRMPLRLDKYQNVIFEDQSDSGGSRNTRRQIMTVLEEHGHSANYD